MWIFIGLAAIAIIAVAKKSRRLESVSSVIERTSAERSGSDNLLELTRQKAVEGLHTVPYVVSFITSSGTDSLLFATQSEVENGFNTVKNTPGVFFTTVWTRSNLRDPNSSPILIVQE